jgi:hypothetical protein
MCHFQRGGDDDDCYRNPDHNQSGTNEQIDYGVVSERTAHGVQGIANAPLPGQRNLCERIRRAESVACGDQEADRDEKDQCNDSEQRRRKASNSSDSIGHADLLADLGV